MERNNIVLDFEGADVLEVKLILIKPYRDVTLQKKLRLRYENLGLGG